MNEFSYVWDLFFVAIAWCIIAISVAACDGPGAPVNGPQGANGPGCNIKAGYVVNLKSGGPSMTVKHVSSNCGTVHVEWFNKHGVEKSSQFRQHMLRKVN